MGWGEECYLRWELDWVVFDFAKCSVIMDEGGAAGIRVLGTVDVN